MTNILRQEFKQEFEKIKKELKFKATLEELDEIFYYTDYILHVNYMSPQLSRTLCGRMVETYSSWINFMHSIIMPNPSSMINVEESKIFTEKEKNEMMQMMKQFMAHVSKNSVIGLTKNKIEEGQFFDDSLKLWQQNKTRLIEFKEKINKHWEIESKREKQQYELTTI
ncbi:MAG: hypothetical protein ACLFN8_01565 [Candidatus Woesearchaeota archaeon]